MLDSPKTTSVKPDLNNTTIAFAHLSDTELRQAYWLFRILGQALVVQLGPNLADFALKFHLPVQTLIKKTIFSHFCGGESIEACMPRIEALARYGIGTILDFAREGGGREEGFDTVRDEVLRTIDWAAQHRSIPFAVFKPSAVARLELLAKRDRGETLHTAEQAAWQRVRARFEAICASAAAKKVPVMIDAEESWIQDSVDQLAQEMMQRFNRQETIVYNTIQLYRHDRLDYLHNTLQHAREHNYQLGLKLVRGAYLEKENKIAAAEGRPSPLNASKEATDRLYDQALNLCTNNLDRIAFVAGTHNERSVLLLIDLMLKKGLAPSDPRISFAQLLGMSDHISYNLASAGFRVAKYVPYGTVAELLPYLTRRAQENSSVAGQSSRELSLLIREMRRRRLK
jgi:proline dehydrogenase